MKWILLFVLLFMCIVGISEMIHNFKLFLIKPDEYEKINICFLKGNKAELSLLHAIEQRKWHGKLFASKIIAIDLANSDTVSDNCNLLAQKYNVEVLKPNEFNILNYGDLNGTSNHKGNG